MFQSNYSFTTSSIKTSTNNEKPKNKNKLVEMICYFNQNFIIYTRASYSSKLLKMLKKKKEKERKEKNIPSTIPGSVLALHLKSIGVIVSSTSQLNTPRRSLLFVTPAGHRTFLDSSTSRFTSSVLPPPPPPPCTRSCEWTSTRFREFKNGKEFLEKDGRERERERERERGRR